MMGETSTVKTEAEIQRLEPHGHQRSQIVFANGRLLVINMELDDLVAAVRDFKTGDQDFLELPAIDVVAGEGDYPAVVVADATMVSRAAVDRIDTIAISWPQRVPGQAMPAPQNPFGNPVLQELNQNAEMARRRTRMNGGRRA